MTIENKNDLTVGQIVFANKDLTLQFRDNHRPIRGRLLKLRQRGSAFCQVHWFYCGKSGSIDQGILSLSADQESEVALEAIEFTYQVQWRDGSTQDLSADHVKGLHYYDPEDGWCMYLLHDHGFLIGAICHVSKEIVIGVAAEKYGWLERYRVTDDSEYDLDDKALADLDCGIYDFDCLSVTLCDVQQNADGTVTLNNQRHC